MHKYLFAKQREACYRRHRFLTTASLHAPVQVEQMIQYCSLISQHDTGSEAANKGKTRPRNTEMTQSLGRAWWGWWCPLPFLNQGMGLPESLVVKNPLVMQEMCV